MKDIKGMYKNRKRLNLREDFSNGYGMFPVIHVKEQDGAMVGTVKGRISGTYEEGITVLEEKIRQVAIQVETLGGVIGHIKAYAREEGRRCMISLTSQEDIQRKESEETAIQVECVQIVFGVSAERLRKILEETFLDG